MKLSGSVGSMAMNVSSLMSVLSCPHVSLRHCAVIPQSSTGNSSDEFTIKDVCLLNSPISSSLSPSSSFDLHWPCANLLAAISYPFKSRITRRHTVPDPGNSQNCPHSLSTYPFSKKSFIYYRITELDLV